MNEDIRRAIDYMVNEIQNNPDDDIVEIINEAFGAELVVAERVDKTPYSIEIRIVE